MEKLVSTSELISPGAVFPVAKVLKNAFAVSKLAIVPALKLIAKSVG